MKIVEPSVTLISSTPDPERVIERMGRICYQSQHKVKLCGLCCGSGEYDYGGNLLVRGFKTSCQACNGTGTNKESAIAFVKMILTNGHESVIEHASAGFSIITDRGVTHEIVRHRLASYSQESTRFCDYNKDKFGGEISCIEPFGFTAEARRYWSAGMALAEQQYKNLIEAGCTPQIARSVLPNSLKSEIGMTANFREWRHFLRLRTSPKAHPQMRQIAEMIRAELLKISLVCFEDIS